MSTKIPSRNTLYEMQHAVTHAFGDPDEYHAYAISRRSDRIELANRKRALKQVDAEIKRFERAAVKYLAALEAVRSRLDNQG